MSNDLYKRFVSWIERINQSDEIPANLCAFNFGLFESEKGYLMYLIGAESYDETDDDWAVEENFAPTEKYFELGVDTSDKRWQEIEELAASLLSEFIKSETFQQSFLSKAEFITVGFDDGDLTRVK
jgi:hypothetical protein